MFITKPSLQFIGGGSETAELYRLEERRTEVIKAVAKEWAKLSGEKTGNQEYFWGRAIPQALFDTLESFEVETSRAAAIAYLEAHPASRT